MQSEWYKCDSVEEVTNSSGCGHFLSRRDLTSLTRPEASDFTSVSKRPIDMAAIGVGISLC